MIRFLSIREHWREELEVLLQIDEICLESLEIVVGNSELTRSLCLLLPIQLSYSCFNTFINNFVFGFRHNFVLPNKITSSL